MKSRRFRNVTLLSMVILGGVAVSEYLPAGESQTKVNLMDAMKGEAFAYVKYSLYAEKAEAEGFKDVASQFFAAAHKERFEHFAELANEYHLVGDTSRNLKDAIDGESSESESIYPGFADQAREEGYGEIADLFEELAKDEAHHREEFQNLLNRLQDE